MSIVLSVELGLLAIVPGPLYSSIYAAILTLKISVYISQGQHLSRDSF